MEDSTVNQPTGGEGVDMARSDLEELPTECTNNRGIRTFQAGSLNRISCAYGCVCMKGDTNTKTE